MQQNFTTELAAALRQSTASLLAILADSLPNASPEEIAKLEPMATALDILERATGTRELPAAD